MRPAFAAAVSALVYSIVAERCGDHGDGAAFPHNRIVRAVLASGGFIGTPPPAESQAPWLVPVTGVPGAKGGGISGVDLTLTADPSAVAGSGRAGRSSVSGAR